jgi:dGTPase
MPADPKREDRLSKDRHKDQRDQFQRDRDRILYTSAFRRLAEVTQVVSPGEVGVFHNRLTHTLKVAQVARRLAEMFVSRRGGASRAEAWGGISPEVVEAAALAHDLGHPPFGHIAEDELNRLVGRIAGADGYEGNAQSFRIVTKLAVRRVESPHGLDLTRATLNATLKYPRLSAEGVKKYGAYRSEEPELQFARAQHPEGHPHPGIEAQIMDWADDITYSVHDTEDFYRAGLVPLDRLAVSPTERNDFLKRAVRRRESIGKPFKESLTDLKDVLDRFCESLLTKEPYTGTRSQRGQLCEFTSKTISDYVQGTKLLAPPGKNGKGLEVPDDYLTQVALLKEMTWCYVINNPALAAHQYGQRKAIRMLFEIFSDAAERRDWALFPPQFQEEANELLRQEGEIAPARRARLVADTIASLTDQQALRLYQRLTGLSRGSVLTPVVG